MSDEAFAACYPEHAKMEEIPVSDRDTIGQFIEWLEGNGFHICRWQETGNNEKPRYLRVTPKEAEQFRHEHPHILQYPKWDDNGQQYYLIENLEFESWESRFVSVHMNPEKWLAAFYKIDLQTLSHEKQQMYEKLRAATQRSVTNAD